MTGGILWYHYFLTENLWLNKKKFRTFELYLFFCKEILVNDLENNSTRMNNELKSYRMFENLLNKRCRTSPRSGYIWVIQRIFSRRCIVFYKKKQIKKFSYHWFPSSLYCITRIAEWCNESCSKMIFLLLIPHIPFILRA